MPALPPMGEPRSNGVPEEPSDWLFVHWPSEQVPNNMDPTWDEAWVRLRKEVGNKFLSEKFYTYRAVSRSETGTTIMVLTRGNIELGRLRP
jgi:hypothetical protein